jgi:hypothetical protein
MNRVQILVLNVLALVVVGCGGEGNQDGSLTADAGDDFEIQVGESPTFDGCTSSGAIENYKWTIVEAPPAMAEDSGKVIREVDDNCSFTLEAAMGLKEMGAWIIELEVSGADGRTATDQVIVTVNE